MNRLNEVENLLKERGIPFKVLDSGNDDPSIDAQVESLGIRYRDAVATLVFVNEGELIGFLRRDDRQLDKKILKKSLKSKDLRFANADDLATLGFEPRLVSPILMEGVSFVVDKAVLDNDEIIVGATIASKAIKLKTKDLLQLIGDYEVVDVTIPDPERQGGDINSVVSGITPSGSELHIGNYFGAIKPHIDLQDSIDQAYYFIADLHALTTVHDQGVLENNIHNVVLDYLALGLDPDKVAFFRQSDVPSHSQLTVVLANYVSFGQMQRMHAFKDKLQKGATQESINMGLFNYPILMAADILIYKPDGVPVGEDQRQHVELTRDIAGNFNRSYGADLFPLPEPLIPKNEQGKVIGTDGERKMSKSLGNVISIFKDEDIIKKQVMGCFTDPNRIRATDPGKVEGNPVFTFHDLLNSDKEEVDDLKTRYKAGTVGDVEVKQKLYQAHMERFAEARERRRKMETDLDLVRDILSTGAAKARKVADQTMKEVYEVIGIQNKLN